MIYVTWVLPLAVAGLAALLGLGADRWLGSVEVGSPRRMLLAWHGAAMGCFMGLGAAALLLAHDVWEQILLAALDVEKWVVHRAYAGSWDVPWGWNAAALLPLLAASAVLILVIRERLTALEVRRAVDLVSSRPTRGRLVVLEGAGPVAFCLAGRHPVVVLGRDLVDQLDDDEVAAVIAHEHAHLARWHHVQVVWAQALGRLLSRVALMRQYAGMVERLVELEADDVAARATNRRTLARALLKTGSAPATTPGLAANGRGMALRVRRLMQPPPDGRRGRTACATVLAVTIAELTAPFWPLAAVLARQ